MKLAIIALLFVVGSISAQQTPTQACVSNLKQGVKLLKTIAKDLEEKSNLLLMADFVIGAELVKNSYDTCLNLEPKDILDYAVEKLTPEQKECLSNVLEFVKAAKGQVEALKNKKFSTFFAQVPALVTVTKKAVKVCPASINF